tara:strand:+ start:2537 stop:2803 length:267 start_codon:yes stop_codon:yes gene_type:complete
MKNDFFFLVLFLECFFVPHWKLNFASVGGPLWEEEKGRTRARDETSGGRRGLVFDEGGSVGHTSVHFLLLLKLFGFSSDNLLKFMEKK